MSAQQAQDIFDDVLEHLSVPSYADAGIVFGPLFKGNQGTAIYNSSFRPFRTREPTSESGVTQTVRLARARRIRVAWVPSDPSPLGMSRS
jgi:hypothetical protein